MAGELREVGVVIIKKETEELLVCKAKHYGELSKHKSHREKLQQLKENLQSLFKRVELKLTKQVKRMMKDLSLAASSGDL